MYEPFISICIPAYKRVEYLNRLLESISIQTFRDFELVISDDSPDHEVAELLQKFSTLPINYFRNEKALGSPGNWNNAIRNAKGMWVKIMHDDDWFSNENSLRIFADAAIKNQEAVLFSNYRNVYLGQNKSEVKFANGFEIARMKKKPFDIDGEQCCGASKCYFA